MPPIVSTIEISRPPDEVFSYVTDPSRFAEWQDDVMRVRLTEGHPLGVGSSSPKLVGSAPASGR